MNSSGIPMNVNGKAQFFRNHRHMDTCLAQGSSWTSHKSDGKFLLQCSNSKGDKLQSFVLGARMNHVIQIRAVSYTPCSDCWAEARVFCTSVMTTWYVICDLHEQLRFSASVFSTQVLDSWSTTILSYRAWRSPEFREALSKPHLAWYCRHEILTCAILGPPWRRIVTASFRDGKILRCVISCCMILGAWFRFLAHTYIDYRCADKKKKNSWLVERRRWHHSIPLKHLLLDSAPNIGPLISRWDLD